jgi:hypothetical protein
MEPFEFLAEVLPPSGNGRYCVAELSKKKEHFYTDTLDEAKEKVEAWNSKGYDIYFALATFGEDSARTRANARMMRCIAIDIDCNHPKDVQDADGAVKMKAYPATKIAAAAVMTFIERTGLDALGTPWLVSSGGGLHAYWPLTEAVTIERWQPVADAFKRLCFQEKLGIDPTVTGDAARVLRIPGTTNTGIKGGKKTRGATQVVFKNEGAKFNLDDLIGIISLKLQGTVYETKAPAKGESLMLPGVRPGAPTGVAAAPVEMFKNSETHFANILSNTKNGKGCGQLEHYLINAKDDGMEPLWRGLLSITAKCDDGKRAAIWLTQKHPYGEERMHQKLGEIKGPYPCTKFDAENPGVCPTCPNWGKITNPLALGRAIATDNLPKIVDVEQASGIVQSVYRPDPPAGYAYGKNGGIYVEKEDIDENGGKHVRLVELLPYDLFPVDILHANGEHTIQLVAVRGVQSYHLTIPQRALVAKDDTAKALASQNILASFGSGNDQNLFSYLRAAVAKMSLERPATKVPDNFGWQPDNSFVHAGMIYRANSEPITMPMLGLENLVANTQLTGKMDAWLNVVNLLVAKELWEILAIMFSSAGSPLMGFTGLNGLTLHCASKESGTGKTLALDCAASIWGHPTNYRTGAGTSPIAMQQRMGLLHSLPMITDEITSINHKDLDWFPAHCFSASEGRGKERMESGANKERLNLSTWSAVNIMSSNTYMVDFMTGVRKASSEGELRRFIELNMDQKLFLTTEEVRTVKQLNENYAVVGDIWTRYLVNNREEMKQLVNETVPHIYEELNAAGDERFWVAGVACAVSAIIGFRKAGIVNVPVKPIIDVFLRNIELARVAIKGFKMTAEDVLNAYVRENFGRFIIVNFGEMAHVLSAAGGASADRNSTRQEVMGRIEQGNVGGFVDFFIEERLLKAYCSIHSFGYATLKKELGAQFMVNHVARKDMTAKTASVPMRVNAIKITMRVDELDADLANSVALA